MAISIRHNVSKEKVRTGSSRQFLKNEKSYLKVTNFSRFSICTFSQVCGEENVIAESQR